MKPNAHMTNDHGAMQAQASAAPSADYINAISEFFDTDPSDLLVELGYYERSRKERADAKFADMGAQQE